MSPLLGLETPEATPTTADYLGNQAPTAFSAQPALPTAGPNAGGGGGASTAPATIGGSGVGVAPAPAEGGFGDLAGAASGGDLMTPGGDPGTPGPGVGVGIAGEGIPGLGVGPVDVSAFGNLSLNTGNKGFDTAFNTVGKAGLGAAGISTNVMSILGQIFSSPVLSTIGSALGLAGLPLTAINVVDLVSRMFSNTVVSQQGRNANMDMAELEAMTPQEIAAMAFGAQGPTAMGWTDPSFQIARHTEDSPVGVGAVPGAGTGAPGTGGVGEGGVGGPGDTGQAP